MKLARKKCVKMLNLFVIKTVKAVRGTNKNKTLGGGANMSQCQNENEWIKTEDGFEYKNIRKNGHWEVIRWRHDVAYYSFCPFCGYMHSCYKNNRNEDGTWGMPIYAPEKEFNYCPMCGKDMEVNNQ